MSYVTISDWHSEFFAFVRPWNLKWSRNCDKISFLWLLHLLIPCTLGRTFITIILMEISCFIACLSVVTAWLASSLFVAELSWWRKFNPLFSKWIPKWLLTQKGKLLRERSLLAFSRGTRAGSNLCTIGEIHAHVQQVANNTRSFSIFESFGDGKLMANVRELMKNLLSFRCSAVVALKTWTFEEIHRLPTVLTCNGQMLDEKVHPGLSTLVDQQSHQDSGVSKDDYSEQYP